MKVYLKIILFLFLFNQPPVFSAEAFHFIKVKLDELPSPYHFLLQQPLMTLGIEKYYQREALIHKVSMHWDKKTNIYSRTITMLIDNDQARNNVKLAEMQKTALVVELAFITINFNALPETIKKAILQTEVPFGKLLAINKIVTSQVDRSYFSVVCDNFFVTYLSCKRGSQIFGRYNTLIRKSDGAWLAKVVEILSAPLS